MAGETKAAHPIWACDDEAIKAEYRAAEKRAREWQDIWAKADDEAERLLERAEAAEKALKDFTDWLDAEGSMLPGYVAAAASKESADWHAGATAVIERVQEKLAATKPKEQEEATK